MKKYKHNNVTKKLKIDQNMIDELNTYILNEDVNQLSKTIEQVNPLFKNDYITYIASFSIRHNKKESLQYALDNKVLLNDVSDDIKEVCEKGYKDVIYTLVQSINYNQINSFFINTFISNAIMKKHTDIAIYILNHSGDKYFTENVMLDSIYFDNIDIYKALEHKNFLFDSKSISTHEIAKLISDFHSYNIARYIIEKHPTKNIFEETNLKDWANSYKNSISLNKRLTNELINTDNKISKHKI